MNAIDAALFTRLTSDSAGAGNLMTQLPGGVHEIIAPAGQSVFPYLTFQCVGAPRDYTFKRLAAVRASYLIKIYSDKRSWNAIKLAMERVITILNDYALSVTGYRTLILRVKSTYDTDEQDERSGKVYALTLCYFTIEVAP